MRRLAGGVALLLAVSGCSQAAGSTELTVFAAASLTETFGVLEREFERAHPGVDVRLSFGGSSRLAEQIAEGAPADVFAAADEKSMTTVASAGLVDGRASVFATNTLTIAVEPGNPKRIEGVEDLASDGLVVVTCAAVVPCGRASAGVAKAAGVRLKPASEEPDVKSVLGKVVAGEADAGLVYVTDVRAADGKVEGVPIAEGAATPNRYPIAALRDSQNSDMARAFTRFVLGDSGQRVLMQAGFGAP